jgi:hypothetical protein
LKELYIRGNKVKPDSGKRKPGIDVNDKDSILAPEVLTVIDGRVLLPDSYLENHDLKRNCYGL